MNNYNSIAIRNTVKGSVNGRCIYIRMFIIIVVGLILIDLTMSWKKIYIIKNKLQKIIVSKA